MEALIEDQKADYDTLEQSNDLGLDGEETKFSELKLKQHGKVDHPFVRIAFLYHHMH